jgi:hypothetical protein
LIWVGLSRTWSKMNSQKNTFNQTSLSNNTSATQCQARVWHSHKPTQGHWDNQCSMKASFNGLCTKHAKQEAVCCVPCTTTEDGKKRIGLYMGRINQWQPGMEGIPPFKDQNNFVRILWETPEMYALIINQVANGLAKWPGKKELGNGYANKFKKMWGGNSSPSEVADDPDWPQNNAIDHEYAELVAEQESVSSSDSEDSVTSSDQTSYSNLEWKLSCLDELDKFTDGQTQIKSAKFLQSIIRNKLLPSPLPIATC